MFERLLESMETRGRHATGVAVDLGDSRFIWKRAVQASLVLQSDAWSDEVISRIDPSVRYVIGHTRHATQNNAHVDECAHPFAFDSVVGAHNGMIYNWRELEAKYRPVDEPSWDVDSQAAFSMLRTHGIRKTLDSLDGYWALTWIENGKLYAVRTPEAPLAMAYVPAIGTLFWASLRSSLVDVLKRNGFSKEDCEIFELNASTLYVFDVNEFGPKGTNRRSRTVTFNGRKRTASQRELFVTAGGSGSSSKGYRSTNWSPGHARAGRGQGAETPKGVAMSQSERIERLERVVRTLVDRVAEIDSDVSYLFRELDLDDGSLDDADETYESLDEAMSDVDEIVTAPADLDVSVIVADTDGSVCYRCEKPAGPGNPLLLCGNDRVHANCVFTGRPARP